MGEINGNKVFVNKVFGHPIFYKYLRGLFLLGLRVQPIRDALALQPGDRVIDVGCGTGDYSIIVDSPQYSYLGVDFNPKYIVQANQVYATPYRQFKVLDILKMRFKEKEFTKAMLIGVMHHLTEEENMAVLTEINRITSERLVIMDLSPGGWNPLSNLLCKLDRGDYPRPLAKQCEILSRIMKVSHASNYYARSGIVRLSLIVCHPLSVSEFSKHDLRPSR